MPEMKPVESSNIDSIGYDGEKKKLSVKFKHNDAIYVYNDIPREKHKELLKSESIGKFLCSEIKGKFLFDKV